MSRFEKIGGSPERVGDSPEQLDPNRDYKKIFLDEFLRPDQTEKNTLKLIDRMLNENKLTPEEVEKIKEELQKQEFTLEGSPLEKEFSSES